MSLFVFLLLGLFICLLITCCLNDKNKRKNNANREDDELFLTDSGDFDETFRL